MVGWVGGPCDLSVSPSPFGLDFGTLDFGTSDWGLTIILYVYSDQKQVLPEDHLRLSGIRPLESFNKLGERPDRVKGFQRLRRR